MATLDIMLWVPAGLLAAFWLLCAGGNLLSLIGAVIRKGSTSFAPFFGGIAGVVSLFVCPLPGTARWAWLPALLDIGCIPMAVVMCYGFLVQRGSRKTGA